MFTRIKYCFICLCCLFGVAANGQSIDNTVGLKELLDRVSTHSSFLSSDSAVILIRLAQQNAARYIGLPDFHLNMQGSLGTNNNMPGGYFSYGIVPGNSRVRNQGNSSTILTDLAIAAFDWNIYDFGENKAQQKVAASDVQVEQSRYQQRKYDLQAFVIDNYLQWMQVEDLLVIQSQNIQRNSEIRQSILALAKSGIKAGVDTSIAEAEISRSRLTYLELEGQRREYKVILSAITNTPVDKLKADTAYADRLIAEDTATNLNDTGAFVHPLLAYYQSVYQNSLEKVRLVKRSYYPSISLQGAVWGRGSSVSADDEFRALSKGFGLERGNYLVGVGITYNLFDIKRKQLQLKTQQAISNHAGKQLKEQQLLLGLTESKLQARLITAQERLAEIPHQLAAARAAYRQKLALYKNGLTDILELNSVLNVLYRAETDLITAKYIYCKTLFERAITSNQVQALLQFTN